MPRNSSGTMAAANGPYIAGTVISSSVVNARFADEEAELTDSLSRSGKGGMTAPLRTADGSVSAPAHSFTSETNSGLYRAGAGDVRLAVSGVDALKLGAGGIAGNVTLTAAPNPIIQASGANSAISIVGNRAATDTGTDVAISATATRTAGTILRLQNGGSDKLLFDYQGLLQLASQATPLQPASIWTAITPGGGWGAAGGGLAYWKDACGMVQMKGSCAWLTGATTLIALPAGFRPASNRQFPVLDFTTGATMWASVAAATGAVAMSAGAPANNDTFYFDSVRFLAEQ